MILSNEEILGIIVDIYENHHIGEFGFNIEKLIREMGYNLIPYSSFEDESQIRLLKSFEEDGFSLFNVKTNKCEIYYNDFIKPKTRLKFTLPHELGHIEQGHIFEDSISSTMNNRADWFSRQLYMPDILLIEYDLVYKSTLMSLFGISDGYAKVIIERINQRKLRGIEYSDNELRLLETFKKNRGGD